MCGIVGFLKNDCLKDIYNGLLQLEYRGYDSAGIAYLKDNSINIIKKQGKVAQLKVALPDDYIDIGIGHTRWATHGRASDNNAHPHACGRFTVAHNGIIENFLELKIMLVNRGAKFLSDTDTEIIAHLLEMNYNGNLLDTLKTTCDMLCGSYALAALCSDYPNTISLLKQDNPLIIGKGDGFNCFASDSTALVKHTKIIYKMQDGDIALMTKDKIQLYNADLNEKEADYITTTLCESQLEKGAYESYMLKEIDEIPSSIAASLACATYNGLEDAAIEKLRSAKKAHLIGCGTAYHAALYGKYLIEKQAKIPSYAEIASEFRYREPLIDKDTLFIAISQSGETADTISAVKTAKSLGAYVIVITNAPGSSITNIADTVLLTLAGAEIAVAATKSYNTQLALLYYLSCAIATQKGIVTDNANEEIIKQAAYYMLNQKNRMLELAKKYNTLRNVFFLGRLLDYTTALEGSLKLKEISYINGEGCASGEIKHGTLALITKDTLVVNIITSAKIKEKSMNAIHEVKARGANVLLITCFEELTNDGAVDDYVILPDIGEYLMPLISIIPLQFFAYYTARARGNDPDKPRNLAKSVTVE